MIPEQERAYEEELRGLIQSYLRVEKTVRAERQNQENKLYTIINQRGAQRLEAGCPPSFIYGCVLKDGTTCPFYHDGQCVKAQEETA